ncbi:MAG: hypothetical protein RI897_2328 [Verrucomicrobiota bacterium]|jgi:hypothetical protein
MTLGWDGEFVRLNLLKRLPKSLRIRRSSLHE